MRVTAEIDLPINGDTLSYPDFGDLQSQVLYLQRRIDALTGLYSELLGKLQELEHLV